MFFIHILVATYFPFLHASLLLSCTPCLFSNCLNFTLNNEVCCNNKNFMTVMSQVHLYKTFTDKINFIPAKDRANPYQMELVFRLFANSVTKIDPIKTRFVYICHKNVHETLTILVQHYHLFPKSLGDVLTTYKVKELHLSQTQGLWKHEKWGYPPEDAPPGDELWVWFQPHSG